MGRWWILAGFAVALGAEAGPSHRVRVVVVDATGIPQERVGVRVQARDAVRPESRWKTWSRTWSDAKGQVELDFSNWRMREGQLHPPSIGIRADPQHPEVRVALDVPWKDPVEILLRPDEARKEALRFVLPSTSALEVEVRTPEGGPPHGVAEVEVHWEGHPDRRSWAMVRDGVARFEHVGVGGSLTLHAKAWGSREALPLTITGPLMGTDTLRATIVLGETLPILEGRIVDPVIPEQSSLSDRARLLLGRPPSSERRTGRIQITAGDQKIREWVSFQPDGTFQFAVTKELPEAGVAQVELWFQKREPYRGTLSRTTLPLPPTHTAKASLSLPVRSGLIDLGDLELRPVLPVADGVVIDEDCND